VTRESDALEQLLLTEHQAIWAYGVIGAHLDDVRRRRALAAYDAHRLLRDDLLARLRALSLPTPGPALAYDLTVTTPGSAVQQAIRVETELCARWRDLVASTDDADLRRLAVRGLSEAAVRATQWRQVGGVSPATVPLPGT
jgi:hypothetical protein